MHTEKERKDLSILIPAYNESESLPELYELICSELIKLPIISEIVIINDGSTDNTDRVIRDLIKDKKPISTRYICIQKNAGKTKAIKTALQYVDSKYILMMDADLQDNPKDIQKFWNAITTTQHSLIVGNRKNRYTKNLIKKGTSKVMNALVKYLAGYEISDMNCGYKIMSYECAKSIPLKSDYHRYIPFLASINGYSVGEVEIEQELRKYGTSKYGKTGIKRFIKSVLDIVSIYFIFNFRENPFNLFGKLGLLLLSAGTLILIYLGIGWLFGNYIYGRPLFFLGILFVIVGINNISLGLLGELIEINTNQNKNSSIIAHTISNDADDGTKNI